MSCSSGERGNHINVTSLQLPTMFPTDSSATDLRVLTSRVIPAHLVLFTLHGEIFFNEDTVCENKNVIVSSRCRSDSSKRFDGPHVQSSDFREELTGKTALHRNHLFTARSRNKHTLKELAQRTISGRIQLSNSHNVGNHNPDR